MKMNENAEIQGIYVIRSKIREETNSMSPRERADYINKRADSALEGYRASIVSGSFSPVYLDEPDPIVEPIALQEIHAIRRRIYEKAGVSQDVD
jgi:hypothetical protein